MPFYLSLTVVKGQDVSNQGCKKQLKELDLSDVLCKISGLHMYTPYLLA